MRNTIIKTTAVLAVCVVLFACKKDTKSSEPTAISDEVLAKIYDLGFSNKNVITDESGNYIVEGDILLSPADLNAMPARQLLRVGTEEQYHTTNLVKGFPRTITVSMSSRLPVSYIAALEEALGRYNALGLKITFQRVASGGHIDIVKASGSYLASAGFPTAAGEPYSQIKLNSRAIGNQPQSTVATILAHELGHCIGFRHTDFMDRSFSCGGNMVVNEGASTVGAIYIPGTSDGPEEDSWMLACISARENRPFTVNDQRALKYLYLQ